MNDKEELYESLVRLWLLLIFTLTLVAGTVGLILICRMIVVGLDLGFPYSLSPIAWFTTEVHYCHDKYEVVFYRVENCVWKKMSKAPTNIFIYYAPASRRLNHSVNSIFNVGDELVC